ncbi:MAG: AAA family ATPase [Clostridia bacterium]|nr:AAA family ATPase [Clostridia bacterium]
MKYIPKDLLIKKTRNKIVPLETQKETLDKLASLISLHLRKLSAIEAGVEPDLLPNNSLLVLARTGCGKSHLIKALADAAGLNVFTIDSSAISPEGYKGTTLSQLFSLAKQACSNKETFSSSIVIIDEFCKMKFRDGETSNPQFNLLQVIEGKGLSCDLGSSRTEFIDTSKMLFIFSGAFDGLEDMIKERMKGKNTIGFVNNTSTTTEKEYLKYATLDDIREYGFNSELLGRIGAIHYIPPLSKEDFNSLLQSQKGSYIEKYAHLFKISGVNLKIDEKACEKIAEMATSLNTGARAVGTILQNALNPTFEAIDRDTTISSVTLSVKNDTLAPLYYHSKLRKLRGLDKITTFETEIDPQELDENFYEFVSTPDEAHAYVNYLMNFTSDMTPVEEMKVYYFLSTCIQYTLEHLPEQDYHLSSLSKLAEVTDTSGDLTRTFSIFDQIMSGESEKGSSDYQRELKAYYSLYKSCSVREVKKLLQKQISSIRKNYIPYNSYKKEPVV